MCYSFRGASDVRYSRCRNRARVDVGLSVGISITVSGLFDKVCVVVVFSKIKLSNQGISGFPQ